MKKLGLVVICLAVLMIFGCSKTQEVEANEGNKCNGWFGKIYNDCSPHTVDTNTHRDEPDTSAGIGVDVTVWKNDGTKLERLENIEVQYKADFNGYDDTHHSVYTVAQVDGTGVVSGIIDKLVSGISKVFSIFDRG